MSNEEPNIAKTELRNRAFLYVARWAWMERDTPPDIHDAAALALDVPSLAHGFYTPGLEERPDSESTISKPNYSAETLTQ